MKRCVRHIVLWLLLVAWLGAAADGTGRLKNYDIWKDLPSERLMEMGLRFGMQDRADSALLCFNIIVNRHYTNNNQDITDLELSARAMDKLGQLYSFYYIDYNKAHKYLLQAEKIATKNRFLSVLSSVYNNLANIYVIKCTYNDDDSYDEHTLQLTKKAFETALEAKNPMMILCIAGNMAHIAEDSTCMEVLREDINMFLHYQIPDSLSKYSYVKDHCQAIIEKYKGNYEKAEMLLDKAYNNVYDENRHNFEIIKLGILENKYHLYLHQGLNHKALDILQSYIKFGKDYDDHHMLFAAYQSLSEYYHNNKKDSITGDRYELLAHREKDIVLNQNKLLDAEKAEFLFQIDEINAEVQELTARQRLTRTIAWTVAAFTLIVLVLLYLLWRRYRQVQENHRRLYENNLALLAVDDERRKLLLEYAAKLDAEPAKYQSHQMDEGEQSDLLHRIFYVLETSEEIYDNDFSLERLAELVEARSSKYVSQVLNEHYHQSFTSVVNDYRIREACRRINDREHYGHLTVEGIAQSVGFKSYPNFVNNFKKFTGLTPSAYRKQSKPQSPADDALSHADGADDKT